MATYKVIQDIEAEDKLIGPLSLRQFIYAVMVLFMGFIGFKLAQVSIFLALPLLPPMIFFGLLAAPLGGSQSTEVWLLAKIRFFLKPRRRIWNQSGMTDLVHVTAPPKIERQLTDGLSQGEVKSRLQALASTLDSRGWAVKNVNVNLYQQPAMAVAASTDRLVDVSSLPQDVPSYDVYASDDILDADSNATAQHLDAMITQSESAHKQALSAVMQGQAPAPAPAAAPQDTNWYMTTAADEQALLEKIHHDKSQTTAYGHTKVLDPKGPAKKAEPAAKPQAAPAPQPVNPVIASLAQNDDLSVETIAHEAQKSTQLDDSNGEVVISLR